jgi:hypothetical protein
MNAASQYAFGYRLWRLDFREANDTLYFHLSFAIFTNSAVWVPLDRSLVRAFLFLCLALTAGVCLFFLLLARLV